MSDFVYSNEHTKMDMAGYLKIIIGPMWSGKSTEVIKIYKHNCIAQISTLVVNYEEDRRYHANKLSTHDKTMIPCKRYINLRDLLKLPPRIIVSNCFIFVSLLLFILQYSNWFF